MDIRSVTTISVWDFAYNSTMEWENQQERLYVACNTQTLKVEQYNWLIARQMSMACLFRITRCAMNAHKLERVANFV